jgi:hypothetical protein
MSRRPWAEADDAVLIQCHRAGVKSVDIAARLGRPRGSINGRAVKLGIAKKAERGDQNPVWIAIKEICADGVARTVHELADATGQKHTNIERMFYLRRDQQQAHIVDYEPVPRGSSRPLWLPVPGVDAQRGEPSPDAIRQKLLRAQRVKEDPDLTPEWKAKVKTGPAPRVIGVPQHELVRALFGMGAPV